MTTSNSPDESVLISRITELEIQLMHQQRIVEQLNSVVVEQSQQIFRLERSLSRLESQIKELRQPAKPTEFDILEEKPPHY